MEEVLTWVFNEIYDEDIYFQLTPGVLQDAASITSLSTAGLFDDEFAVPLAVQALNGSAKQAADLIARKRRSEAQEPTPSKSRKGGADATRNGAPESLGPDGEVGEIDGSGDGGD